MIANKNNLCVYVDPWANNLLDNKLFNVTEKNDSRIDYLLPYIYLEYFCKQNGIILLTADKIPNETNNIKKYIYYSFGQLGNYKKIKDRKDIVWGSFYLFEPPIKVLPRNLDINYELPDLVKTFKRVYTTSPVDAINKCYNTSFKLSTNLFCYPQSHNGPIEKLWNITDRKFLVMVNSYRYSRLRSNEYYSERIKALNYFFPKNLIDLYGSDWNKLSTNLFVNGLKTLLWTIKWCNFIRVKDFINAFRIRKYLKNINATYDKYSTLSNYKYAICYDSMGIEGFITEKIFDCFFSGTIPVYLGAPDINIKIPKDTFIDKRNFKSYDDLYMFLKNINKDQYENYRNKIKNFIMADEFKPFTMNYFAERFLVDVKEDLSAL